jgi:hypothetical protein
MSGVETLECANPLRTEPRYFLIEGPDELDIYGSDLDPTFTEVIEDLGLDELMNSKFAVRAAITAITLGTAAMCVWDFVR